LELGIDIGSIDLVVLYGMPANWQSLAQRVGRGNRRNDFIEALFCVPTKGSSSPTFLEQLTFQALLAEMFQHESSQVTAQELRGAFAQQLCSELDARGGFVGIKTLAAIGEPWPHLNSQVTADVLDTLVEAGVLQKHPAYNRYGADRGLHELRDRWQIWSNFAGSGQFIDVRTRDRHIGTIGVQNSKTLGVGEVFILGGRRWKVERIEPSGIAVTSTNAEPTRTVEQGGTRMNPSQTLADWARLVICDSKEAERVFPRVGGEGLRDLVKPIRQLLKVGAIPLLRNDGKYHYLTFGGALINATLATRFGIPKLTDSVVLSTNDKADFRSIPDSIDDLVSRVTSSPSERSQFQNLLPEGMIVEEDRSILSSDPTLPIILHRLRSSPVVEVRSPNLLTVLGFTVG
jgi:ATP-dependent Lhr-like helicase